MVDDPKTQPPRMVAQPDRPGVHKVVTDIDGMPVTLAEVYSADGCTITAEDVTTVLRQRKRPEMIALEDAVNRRIREVWRP